MKKPSPLMSIGIRYGIIAGLLCGMLLMATYYLMERHPLMVSPFMDYRVILFGVFIFFSLREYREVHQNGALYFSQGMIGSFIFIMVAGTISAVLLWAFCSFEGDFIPSYAKAMTDYLNTFGKEDIDRIGKDVFENTIKQLPLTTAKQIAGKYFIQSAMIGFFVSIILSVILRKESKTP